MTTLRAPAWLLALLLVVAGPGRAAPVAAQEACDGVRVVVDAVGVGGQVTTRCADGDPSTGLESLRMAGHTYEFVPRQPGMVCTIDARPDPCNGAPTDAYWSYWHAEAGGSWTYGTRGAGNRDPAPGTVEGWAFGAGDPPRQPPPAAAPPATDPSSAPEPSAEPAPPEEEAPPAPDPTDPPTTDAGVPGGAPDATPTEDEDADAVASLPSPDPSASPSVLEGVPGPDSSPGPSPEPLAGEVRTDDDGLPIGLLAGGVLIAGLAGAGVVRGRRRDDG